MRLKRFIWVASLLLVTIALTSCNIGKATEPTADVNAIFTSAAGTMIAQLNDQQTQTAQAVTDTPQTSPTPFDTMTPQPTGVGGTIPFNTTPASGTTPFNPTAGFNLPGLLTPLATVAPTSGTGASSFPVGCNDAEFIGETIPDGTIIHPGKSFDKAWSMLNNGTCAWDEGYSFNYKSGEQLQGQNVLLTKRSASTDFTKPGHSQAFIVQMWAPGTAGEYKGFWQMKDDKGEWFGSIVSVDIVVHR